MSSFVFAPPQTPGVAIEGSTQLFPVHRIYCVGKNYADHVREMGGDPAQGSPTFFSKPADTVVPSGSKIAYPLLTKNLHYEAELVVCIGKEGVKIPLKDAADYIFGYAVGIDLTRRDMQEDSKKGGLPWDTSKGFDESAPIGEIKTGSALSETSRLQLKVNGTIRQDATLNQMIWSVPEIVSTLSEYFVLKPGDLIYTGTPAGVGPIVAGDKVSVTIEGLPSLDIEITSN